MLVVERPNVSSIAFGPMMLDYREGFEGWLDPTWFCNSTPGMRFLDVQSFANQPLLR